MERLLSAITVLPFDTAAANDAARVRHDLERIGQKIGPHDVLIAGHALSASLKLVTRNAREFGRIEALPVLDWRVPA